MLGDSFNEHLRALPAEDLSRLHREYVDGIDAWQHVEPEAREVLRPSDAAELRSRRSRRIRKEEVWNSATVADNLEVGAEREQCARPPKVC